MLGGECSCFVLSSFGLSVWSDVGTPADARPERARAHTVRRLMAFLDAEPALCRAVAPDPEGDIVIGLASPGVTISCRDMPEGAARFAPPIDWHGEPLTSLEGMRPLARIVLRFDRVGGVDVWVRVNHVGADGAPMQEILTRLETAWGGADGVRYPTHEEFAEVFTPVDLVDRPGFAEGQCFIDFAPLLKWRAATAQRLGLNVTLAAAVQWHLGRHPGFRAVAIGSTVETPAVRGSERGVGIVVVRPSRFTGDDAGLSRFISGYNRDVELTRRRASGACRTLDAAAYLAPRTAGALLAHALEHRPDAFGDAALTVLRHARVFGAPIGGVGHQRGFLALGDVALPTRTGTKVGCVTFKGPRDVVQNLPRMLREAVERAGVAAGSC
jgi:hypothetical protein